MGGEKKKFVSKGKGIIWKGHITHFYLLGGASLSTGSVRTRTSLCRGCVGAPIGRSGCMREKAIPLGVLYCIFNKNCVYLRCTTCFDRHRHSEMITTLKLLNIFISLRVCVYVCLNRCY